MNKKKYLLFLTLFISTFSFANVASEQQVTLPSIMEVISFCSSDKNCISIDPVIEEQALNYDVKYQAVPETSTPTDPTKEDIDE